MEKDIINELTPEVLKALCVDYSSAYICDLKKDTAHPLKIMEKSHSSVYMDQTGDADIRFSGLLKYFYDHVLIKESVPGYLEIFDRENLMEYLSEHEYLVVKHQTLPNQSGKEYFEAKIVKLHSDESHFRVILGYRSIDDIVVEEKKNERIAREKAGRNHCGAERSVFNDILCGPHYERKRCDQVFQSGCERAATRYDAEGFNGETDRRIYSGTVS